VAERQFEIGESEVLACVGDEILAPDRGNRFEHARVEHVPGTHLLFDHVAPSQFDICEFAVQRHGFTSFFSNSKSYENRG